MLHALFHFVFVSLESLFAAWPKGREQLCPRCYTHTHHSFGVALVSHTALTHNFLTHTQLCHILLTPAIGVAGVAFGNIDAHFVWQAWHLVTWMLKLCQPGCAAGPVSVTATGSKWPRWWKTVPEFKLFPTGSQLVPDLLKPVQI